MWGKRTIEENTPECIATGNLRLWILRRDSEVWVGHIHTEAQTPAGTDSASPPDDLEWSRWAMKTNIGEIGVTPVFPDLPLVVTSEFPLRISSSTKIQIFTRIPIWIRISIPQQDYRLAETPTVKLSRTWFGTPLEGELCYHATTKARRSLSRVEVKPYLVNCPIIINNKSSEDLDFEKFCYRVERLSIYQHKNELWADETEIIHHGTDLNSDILMTGKLPEGIDKKNKLSEPRQKIQKSLATRTFKRFFEDTGFLGRQ